MSPGFWLQSVAVETWILGNRGSPKEINLNREVEIWSVLDSNAHDFAFVDVICIGPAER